MERSYYRTTYAVWEVTLKCNLACMHCGSRAGSARQRELSTAEALDLIQQLATIGVKEVALIGGEAFLRPDWLCLADAITRAGMLCSMVTGGFGISAATAQRMKDAGIALVSVSIDGLENTHDRLRGRRGSWHWCFETLRTLREAAIVTAANTQINRLSAPELPALYSYLRDAEVAAWLLQLTAPAGNAADHADLLLQPPELLDLFPLLARVARRAWQEGLELVPVQNIGYFGPYERLLRSGGQPWGFWQGPEDGLCMIGIEADGGVKANPALPPTPYVGGNVRDRSLREIVSESPALAFNLGAGAPAGTAHLWGFCATCEFGALCRGGDPWTAHTFFGRRGNNPYCYHRAATLRRRGLRERLYPVAPAPGTPLDHGIFASIEEPSDAPWDADDSLHFTSGKVHWPADWPRDDDPARLVVDPLAAVSSVVAPDSRWHAVPSVLKTDVWADTQATPGTTRDEPATLPPLLPRAAWTSHVAHLRALLHARNQLEVAERELVAGLPERPAQAPA
jgi:radical SAM protein with 4Fe4S-binding SPASM domain